MADEEREAQPGQTELHDRSRREDERDESESGGWGPLVRNSLKLVLALVGLLVVAWLILVLVGVSAPNTVGLVLSLVGVVWGTIAFAFIEHWRHEDEIKLPPAISNMSSLSRKVIHEFYGKEIPLWDPGGNRSSHTASYPLAEFSDPDIVEFTPNPRRSDRVYRLDPELESLSWIVSKYLERSRRSYRRNDKVAIVTGIEPEDHAVKIGIAKGLLSDEYATSQNPEMNYEFGRWEKLANVGPRTVRQFFAGGANSLAKGNAEGLLPGFWKGPKDTRKPALRLASHLVILLPKREGADTPWSQREFLMQVRSPRVATGRHGLTSSMGSGMDYADARFRNLLRRHWNGHDKFTNYVLRELRAEVQIQSKELAKFRLVAITRDMERLGQPTAILLGELDKRITFKVLEERWKRARGLRGMFFRALQLGMGTGTGSEHWESRNLVHRTIGEIDDILIADNVEGGTKACLYYLKDAEIAWDRVEPWVPRVALADR